MVRTNCLIQHVRHFVQVQLISIDRSAHHLSITCIYMLQVLLNGPFLVIWPKKAGKKDRA